MIPRLPHLVLPRSEATRNPLFAGRQRHQVPRFARNDKPHSVAYLRPHRASWKHGRAADQGGLNLIMTCLARSAILALLFSLFSALTPLAQAQDNYEIQVYGADTVAPRSTMFEIHSNFTVEGSKTVEDGVLPSNHAEHETLEITQGINDWAEVGFYVFTSIQPDGGWQWVGDHIRPRVRVPASGIGR